MGAKIDAIAVAYARELVRSGRAREIRLAADLSLADVAEHLETTAPSVFRWENGARVPRRLAVAYAELLNELTAGGKGANTKTAA
jgi:DNA-binding transcriptional regulator YiaG